MRGSVEVLVQADSRVDEREMRERLREVTALLAGLADLLRVQAEVVAVGVHLLERQLRVLQAPAPARRVDIEVGAQRGRAIGPTKAVRCRGRVVPGHETVGD